MNKYTCIIVDDEPQAIDLLTDILSDLYKDLEVIAAYTQWSKALDGIRNQPPDLVFMDISMQGKTGIELVRYMSGIKSEVIFVTAYSDYALDAFRVSAAGYILKPVDEAELVKTVDRALERINDKRQAAAKSVSTTAQVQNKIGIPSNNAIDYINTDEIIYLEAVSSYTNVFTPGKKIISSYNLQKFKQTLSSELFFQVHRSYVINLNYVRRYENIGMLIMLNDAEIPVSKNVREDFLKLFNRVKSVSLKKS
jgi:two-component system, LytTR family, response regulator